MAEMVLILGYGIAGKDVLPKERMAVRGSIEVEAHVCEALEDQLTRNEMSQIMRAAKAEFGRVMRARARKRRAQSRNKPSLGVAEQ